MRMWMVPTIYLCRKHLLGEHSELHKHRHIFEKQRSIKGYIENNCIEPMSMKLRHEQLVMEMLSRGYKHQSPYERPDINYLPLDHLTYEVDRCASLIDLLLRCKDCRERFRIYGKL